MMESIRKCAEEHPDEKVCPPTAATCRPRLVFDFAGAGDLAVDTMPSTCVRLLDRTWLLARQVCIVLCIVSPTSTDHDTQISR